MSDETLYEKLISENLEKGWQYKLVISSFRGAEYLSLRKYFLSYDGEWVPTKEGATVPATIESIYALLEGLLEICAYEENKQLITEFLQKVLDEQQNSRVSE